jgi:hypothetical protein
MLIFFALRVAPSRVGIRSTGCLFGFPLCFQPLFPSLSPTRVLGFSLSRQPVLLIPRSKASASAKAAALVVLTEPSKSERHDVGWSLSEVGLSLFPFSDSPCVSSPYSHLSPLLVSSDFPYLLHSLSCRGVANASKWSAGDFRSHGEGCYADIFRLARLALALEVGLSLFPFSDSPCVSSPYSHLSPLLVSSGAWHHRGSELGAPVVEIGKIRGHE